MRTCELFGKGYVWTTVKGRLELIPIKWYEQIPQRYVMGVDYAPTYDALVEVLGKVEAEGR